MNSHFSFQVIIMMLSYEQEQSLVRGILTGAGFRAEDAAIIADIITHSDFTGVYSHGLSRLTRYLNQIKAGSINRDAAFRKLLDDQAVLGFDGDNGFGILSVNKAYDEAVPKAREFGVAFATGKHNANIGCGSYYGWRAVKDDLICVLGCNTYAFSSPWGGADRLIGTNPIIAGFPSGEEFPIVVDISTTTVAMGKIQAFEREGKPIPADWARDYDGRPTTNPAEAFSLTPIAAHKGYGLAVMVDMLSTMLSGACYGSDLGLFSKLEKENTGFFLILIDPSKFMPIEDFKKNVDRYVRMMKDSRRAAGVEEIFLPGEIEFRKFEENKRTGMAFTPALEAELTQLSVDLGVLDPGASFEELVHKFSE